MLLASLIYYCRSDHLAISVNRVGYPSTNDPKNNVTLRCAGAISDVNFTLNGTVIGPEIVQDYSQIVEENVARFIITQGEEGYYACENDEDVSDIVTITGKCLVFSRIQTGFSLGTSPIISKVNSTHILMCTILP